LPAREQFLDNPHVGSAARAKTAGRTNSSFPCSTGYPETGRRGRPRMRRFKWIEWNLQKIDAHGLSAEEVEAGFDRVSSLQERQDGSFQIERRMNSCLEENRRWRDGYFQAKNWSSRQAQLAGRVRTADRRRKVT
jgi:hypothetical protein